MTEPPIRTVNLRKTYRGRRSVEAVAGVDLQIVEGEFFGLLGPNGAGKSTTIGMLTTRVLPTSGEAYVGGRDVARAVQALDGVRRVEWDGKVLRVFAEREDGLIGDLVEVGATFSTILVPGLVSVSLTFSGLMAVMFPLVMELSWTKEIEDRALAPVPTWTLAAQKIVAGALQALIAAGVVFPVVYFVHAAGQAPSIHVHNWGLFIAVLLLACLLGAALGLLLGTIIDPQRIQVLMSVILLPITFLGCVYYPWSALHSIRWLQILTLFNPVVYVSEGLRAALTPQLGHLPTWAFLAALAGGLVVVGGASMTTFRRRVVT